MAGMVRLDGPIEFMVNRKGLERCGETRKGNCMTHAEAKDVGAHLIQLLTQQRLMYQQLRELAQKQTLLVDGSDPEMLLRVLAGRQRIIDRLGGIDRELKPIRAQWQEIAKRLPDTQREQAQQLVEEVQAILNEILIRDEKDTKALSNQHQQVASKIRNTTTGKRMHQAYGQNNHAGHSKYLDTVSS